MSEEQVRRAAEKSELARNAATRWEAILSHEALVDHPGWDWAKAAGILMN